MMVSLFVLLALLCCVPPVSFSSLCAADDIVFSVTDIGSLNSSIVLPIGLMTIAEYSSTAIVFRWDRVSDATLPYGTTLKYEVSRDGIVLGVTDGNTFFVDSGLKSGRTYIFNFVVIRTGALGETRSVIRRLDVTMPSRFRLTSIPPARPSNVKLVRYSDTAAELFWDRSTVEARVVATEIYRNDGLLVTVTGTSFYDDTRVDDMDYSYTLVAITESGERSGVTSYPPTSDEPSLNKFTIDETNVENFLTIVSSIVTGKIFDGLLDDTFDLSRFNEIEGVQLVYVTDNGPEFLITKRYECESGGDLTVETPAGVEGKENSLFFDSCGLSTGRFHGNIQYSSGASGSVSVATDLVRKRFSGVLESAWVFGSVELSPDELTRSVILPRSSFEKGEGEQYDIEFYKTRTTHATDELNANDTLTLSTSWLADHTFGFNRVFTTKTDRKFERCEEEMYFSRGLLLLELFEGDVIMSIQANNGDPDSFQFTVEQNDVLNSYAINWNEKNRLY